ncbi:MAG: hypothetical protein CM15mP84_05340 [Cellvibrionales bacterium]|nr:MAG: hypothetical protein CM15mP84_05340 [Cellvibrionales bacterium]
MGISMPNGIATPILPDESANLGGQTPPQIIEHSTTVTANFQMPAFGDFDWIANLQLSHNGTMEGGKPSGGTVETLSSPSWTFRSGSPQTTGSSC